MNVPLSEYRKLFFFCADGLPFIAGLLVLCIAVTLALVRWPKAVLIVLAVFLWLSFMECCYFFRDPERKPPGDQRLVVAPADGKIIGVGTLVEDTFMRGECSRVSIFMNIFSVHVNRSPVSGTIVYSRYNPGKFISAFKEKASLDNEQVSIGITRRGEGGKELRVLVRLIAGLIARRIVVWKSVEDKVAVGERMSLIKFGSRVDLFLPTAVTIKVKEGDWVRAGETVIGVMP